MKIVRVAAAIIVFAACLKLVLTGQLEGVRALCLSMAVYVTANEIWLYAVRR